MFIVGIDGGGTSTKLELRNRNNEVLERVKFGPFNINAIGPDHFRKLLREVFAYCGGMESCASLCIGAAGISNQLLRSILQQELQSAGFSGKLQLVGDQEIALRGAMDEPGIALISGTGSIAFGKNVSGETARCGGYGHLIDDEGSGYALGRDGLSAVVRAYDGRGGETMLTQAFFEKLSIQTIPELIAFIYSKETDKAKIAQISLLVAECAEAGDAVSLEILRKGAEELKLLVAAIQEKLDLHGCKIALLGGLIGEQNRYREIVAETLSALGTPIVPDHDALWGAAQMAFDAL